MTQQETSVLSKWVSKGSCEFLEKKCLVCLFEWMASQRKENLKQVIEKSIQSSCPNDEEIIDPVQGPKKVDYIELATNT